MLLENCGMPDDSRVRNEAIALVEKGFEVAVICPRDPGQKWYELYHGVHLYRYPAPWEFPGLVGYLWEFGYSVLVAWLYAVYIFFRRGFDAVHVHSPPDMNCVVAIFFKIVARKKYVLDTHDLSPELYDAQRNGNPNKIAMSGLSWFEKRAVKWADCCIATNESQKAVQISRGGAQAENCFVVRNGPTKRFLDPIEPGDEIPADGRTVVGYVGMIGIQDGVDRMVQVAYRIRTEHERDDFLFVIVGDGPAKENLEQLSAELNLEKFVHFTGLVPFESVPSYIAAFDICLTPDPSNPYNDSCTTIKTMEYMAIGKPTVAFETTENKHTAGISALYAANNDVSEFANHVVRLMDDKQLRQELGQCGRERAVELFTWERQKLNLWLAYDHLFQHQPTKTEALSLNPTETSAHFTNDEVASCERATP